MANNIHIDIWFYDNWFYDVLSEILNLIPLTSNKTIFLLQLD